MKHIKFAGLASEWTAEYANAYVEKLFEIGYYAKAIILNGKIVVAYGLSPFKRADIDQGIAKLFSEGDNKEEIEGHG